MTAVKVWDPFIRAFHWSLVAAFTANAVFTDPEKWVHEWIGYAVVVLILMRILWGLIGPKHARFRDFPPTLSGSMAQLREIATWRRHSHPGHSPLGALMIYNLILTMLLIGATGYMMTTDTFWGVDWVQSAHEAFVTWAELSVFAHILAVVVESRRLRVNLPKAMLTGYKTLPDPDGPD